MLPSSREGIAAFERALYDSCALLRPPEKLSIAEWADKYGMLSSEGSARPGKWYTSNAEYQREPMETLTDPRFPTTVMMWASQLGKTAVALFLAAYFIEHDPSPILFVEPDENLAKTISKDRIDPMIRDTPVLTPLFGKNSSKGAGNDTLHKSFPGGHITFAWASSPTQMASRPVRVLITDEEGAYASAPNQEGNPVKLGRARLATFPNRVHLRVSTPRLKRTCFITGAFDESDQRFYYMPCPQCGHMQTLRWEQLNRNPADAFYTCEANGCVIVEADKFAMVRAGEWRAHNPGGGDGRTAGFHLNALYSTIGYTWSELIAEYLACKGIPLELQTFTNTKLALPWDEQAEGADLNELQKRCEDYAAQAPAWVVLVTCGTDVQKDRIEATKWGFGLNNVSGVIEHRIFYGATDIHRAGAWLEFDAWRRLRVEHESGLDISTAVTFVDSGDGNRTQAVYEYCKFREREKVYACKGSSQAGAPLVGEAKRVGRTKTLLVMVGSSTAKDTIFARFQISDPKQPGYIHFPNSLEAGCGEEYFAHLTAEALVTRQTRSGEKSSWEKLARRNEALDCGVYALAAFAFTKAPLREIARRMAERAAKLDPEEVAARRKSTRQIEGLAKVLRESGLPVPSRVSPSQPANIPTKKKKKIIRRPGYGWIHRN